jgi:ferredoxin
MRVVVDHKLCEGNARRTRAAEVFEVHDDGRSYVVDAQPALRGKVEAAASLCPLRQAIRLV